MEQIRHYIYWYLIHYHPIYWLWNKAQEYEPLTNMGAGVWLAVAIFGIAAWFGITRFFAEGPGRKHGNMYIWWILITAIHVFALPIYIVYDIISTKTRKRWQSAKDRKYSDRSRADIYASARRKPPPIIIKRRKK